MNENCISVHHKTHHLLTLNLTYSCLLRTSRSSICVQFTDFGLHSVPFCTIIWQMDSGLQMTRTSFIYLGLHGGIPYFLNAQQHGDARFVFSDIGMWDPELIMNHGS